MDQTESETDIQVTRDAATLEWCVTLGARLDVYAATNLVAVLQMALREPGGIRIELNGNQRAHAAVVQVLVAAARACAIAGRSFALSGLSLELASTLQLAGLADYLPIAASGEAQKLL
jgi:anti-anti-sigma factor